MNNKSFAGAMMFSLGVLCVAILVAGLWKVLGKAKYTKTRQRWLVLTTILVFAVWMGGTAVLALNGFFASFASFPPRPVLLIILPLPFIFILAFSKGFTAVLRVIPPHWLIGMQAFRILVELLLLRAYTAGLLPKQMTFEGWNFDIISGLLAIPVALIIARKPVKWMIIAYNITGICLLLNILAIAVLSMPTPIRQFFGGPANSIVAEFPFIYLPGVLVVIAYSLHIFSLRQLKFVQKTAKTL